MDTQQATESTQPHIETAVEQNSRILRNILSLIDNQQVTGIAQANAIIEMGTFVKGLLDQTVAQGEAPNEAATN